MEPATILLDGAMPGASGISRESLELSRLVKDSGLSLIDRVESYEDIMNLEVGDTSFTRARNLERDHGIRQLYLKFEGNNPTGTHKDRIAFRQCHDALRREFGTIALASCGNYGAAMALASRLGGLRCIIYIPEQFHSERIREIEKNGALVKRHPGSYEDAVRYAIRQASKYNWYDANPGGVNTPLQVQAYSEIAFEIYDALRDAPKMVAVPVSNGTLLAGVYRGFVSLHKRGKTSRIPRLIAASSSHKNPIIYSFTKNLDSCVDLVPDKIRETRINEPLINWHSFDGEEALYALRQSNGRAFNISDEKMMGFARQLKDKEGLHVLPASTAGLVAMLELNGQEDLEPDRYVVILTGKRIIK
jgi:threonine synthase